MKDFKSSNEHFNNMYSEGSKMNFAHGGYAKKMPSMDNANIQRKESDAADQRSKEFGNQSPVKPGYKDGGKTKSKKKKSESMLKKAKKALSKSAHERRMAKYGLDEGGTVKKAGGGYMKGGKHNDMDYDEDDMKYGHGGPKTPAKKGGKMKYASGGRIKVHNSTPRYGK